MNIEGPDPAFPYLTEAESFAFPSPELSQSKGVVAIGGNLSPGMLLSAYRQGLFPWYSAGEPLLWWSPDPRFVLFPPKFVLNKSLAKVIRRGTYTVTIDTAFDKVIAHCANVKRPQQDGTWIMPEMIDAYRMLHQLGYAHSIESWLGGELAGGLYGVSLGTIFFGESMFSLEPNASKVAFASLVTRLAVYGFTLIDSQVKTDHVARFGGEDIPRKLYLKLLADAMIQISAPDVW